MLPTFSIIDPIVRGVLPESFSFGVFAVALWALGSAAADGKPARLDRFRSAGCRGHLVPQSHGTAFFQHVGGLGALAGDICGRRWLYA